MADERIDIEVIDKVAKTIKPELLGISQAARNAHMQIAKLKRELGVTPTSGIAKATRDVASAEREASRAGAERARQSAATARALDREAASAARLQAKYEQQARAASAQAGINRSFGIGGSRKSAADSYAIFDKAGKIDETTRKLDAMGKKAELGRNHLLNLGFQLQDIFVSLTSGQKPLTVFIQQGGQIGQIAAQSGVGFGGMAKAAGSLLLRFAPLALAAGGVAIGLGLISREANKDEPIKKYAQSLGLTAKEMKKLEDVTITTGDTLQAVWNVTLKNIAAKLGVDTKAISNYWNRFLDGVFNVAKITTAGIYAMWFGMGEGVKNIVRNLGNGKSDDNPFKNIRDGYASAYNEAMTFYKDVGAEQEKVARGRIKEQADALKADRTPRSGRKGAKGVDRAAELAKINRELDQEFRLLQMIGKERDNEARWLDISNGLIDKKIKLTALETKTIQDKIKANRDEQDIQSTMQSYYEEIQGPHQTFQNGQEALNRLLAQGKIETADYNRQIAILNRNYGDSLDYLAPMTRELEKQAKLVGTFGRNRQYGEFLQQLEDAAGPGRSIYKQAANDNSGDIIASGGKTLTNQAQLLVTDFLDQLKQQDLTSVVEELFNTGNASDMAGGNNWIIDNYKDIYAQIEEMRRNDVISEQEAQNTKHQLEKRYLEARLEGADKMFGQLATLQSSHVKEVAAIGKAAAIAQATMDGIKAVQAALAGPPGPPWSFAIAAATGIATAANVAKIAGIGFQSGGYTGDLPAHAVAGAVHGREYVMDAPATARLGVANLEALRTGRLNPGPAANSNGAKVTIINNAGVQVEARQNSNGELEVMIENAMERKMGPMFERRLSNANSRESRSIGNNYKVARNRQ